MATRYARNFGRYITGNRELTDTEIMRVAPSVYAESVHESRSAKYRFLPTGTILNGLRDQGFLPVNAAQGRSRIEGKENFTRHMLRLRHRDYMEANPNNGNIPEIVLVNSHDGTSAYRLMAGIFRMVCTNGLIVGDPQYDMRVSHVGAIDLVQDVVSSTWEVARQLPSAMQTADTMRETQINRGEAMAFAQAALAIRYGADEETGRVQAPVEPQQLISPRRWYSNGEQPDNVWTAYNNVQENLVRGGVPGRTKKGGRMHTRAINSVNEDIRLNRALWVLAEELRKAVA